MRVYEVRVYEGLKARKHTSSKYDLSGAESGNEAVV